MRVLNAGVAVALATMAVPAIAQEAFDACEVFTQEDAQKALGTAAEAPAEPINPKTKRPNVRPKVVPTCTYNGFKEGKPVAATAQFRFGKTEADAQKAFEDHRMQFQTKPMLISGAEAFWSSKTGQMNLRKGRAWVTVSVGGQKLSERDVADAKKLAEILAKKM